MMKSKLTELKIVALLSNHGVRLDKYFLNPIIRKEEFSIIGTNDNPEIIVDKNGGEKTLRRNDFGFSANDINEASKRFKEAFPSVKDLNFNKKATN